MKETVQNPAIPSVNTPSPEPYRTYCSICNQICQTKLLVSSIHILNLLKAGQKMVAFTPRDPSRITNINREQ
jgi:hypothetical protein